MKIKMNSKEFHDIFYQMKKMMGDNVFFEREVTKVREENDSLKERVVLLESGSTGDKAEMVRLREDLNQAIRDRDYLMKQGNVPSNKITELESENQRLRGLMDPDRFAGINAKLVNTIRQIASYTKSRNKLAAIKLARSYFGIYLRDAKDLVEDCFPLPTVMPDSENETDLLIIV